jgi:hypothetical protein
VGSFSGGLWKQRSRCSDPISWGEDASTIILFGALVGSFDGARYLSLTDGVIPWRHPAGGARFGLERPYRTARTGSLVAVLAGCPRAQPHLGQGIGLGPLPDVTMTTSLMTVGPALVTPPLPHPR